MIVSVRPANCSPSVPFGTSNSVAQTRANAFSPAPPEAMSVPSISNKTRRTIREKRERYGVGASNAISQSTSRLVQKRKSEGITARAVAQKREEIRPQPEYPRPLNVSGGRGVPRPPGAPWHWHAVASGCHAPGPILRPCRAPAPVRIETAPEGCPFRPPCETRSWLRFGSGERQDHPYT